MVNLKKKDSKKFQEIEKAIQVPQSVWNNSKQMGNVLKERPLVLDAMNIVLDMVLSWWQEQQRKECNSSTQLAQVSNNI